MSYLEGNKELAEDILLLLELVKMNIEKEMKAILFHLTILNVIPTYMMMTMINPLHMHYYRKLVVLPTVD